MEKNKKYICIFILIIIFMPVARIKADIIVYDPAGMIEHSDLIITGIIKERDYRNDERKVSIAIDKVLKGTCDKDELMLQGRKDPQYGWLGFDFPEAGTSVMVLMHNGELTADKNNVAVIKGMDISLYNGVSISGNSGSKSIKDYENEYEKLLKSTNRKYNTDALMGKQKILKTAVPVIGLMIAGASLLIYNFFKNK